MDKLKLQHLYVDKKFSSREIAKFFKCSENKVNYWLEKFDIKKRTISEAIYQKNNPKGDPFLFKTPNNFQDMFLFGLGLGLFWGEGSKKNINSVRLSNSDPFLIENFINFLVRIYKIDKKRIKFQLLTYDLLTINKTIDYWAKCLGVKKDQFSKTTVLHKRGSGTYNKNTDNGVVIMSFNNTKLRNSIYSEIEKLSKV